MGLVLSSSARVSQVTYQTVVGVRYPELVTFNGTSWRFGKYVPQESPQRGGFLPIFWDVPRANIHAVEDIGAVVDWLTERCEFHADAKSNLAVLHNRNDMTNLFRASNWVSSSHDSIVSRGVTTCAGMTAHTVLLAQTKVGFLTGGRKKYFLALPEDEQMVQLEEAYARATVAITRARALCLIMGPLDMKGLLGAATVMGTLMYGAGHVWAGHAHFFMIMNSPVHRQMRHSLICSNRTVACLVRTSLPQQLWKPCKIMSLIITKYVDYTSLWLTCGGHGSTILPGPERSLTNFGAFLTMMTHTVWAPFGQRALNHQSGAVVLLMDMLWMALNVQVTWCGLKEMGNLIFYWIPPQLTHSLWIKISFAPWVCNISMIPLHLSFRYVSEGTLWLYLA